MIEIPLIKDIPVIGPLLSGNTLLVYVSWLLVPVCWAFIYKTPMGFHLRASGEYPDALTAAGRSPERMKCLASVLCGLLSALAGAHLSLGYLTMFSENMSASRGYVAFACVIFGRGNPPKVFLAALLFGFIEALGLRMQKYMPSDLTAMAPYVVTVAMMVAVVLMERRKAPPCGVDRKKRAAQAFLRGPFLCETIIRFQRWDRSDRSGPMPISSVVVRG